MRREVQLDFFGQAPNTRPFPNTVRLSDFMCGECWLETDTPAPAHGRCEKCQAVPYSPHSG